MLGENLYQIDAVAARHTSKLDNDSVFLKEICYKKGISPFSQIKLPFACVAYGIGQSSRLGTSSLQPINEQDNDCIVFNKRLCEEEIAIYFQVILSCPY